MDQAWRRRLPGDLDAVVERIEDETGLTVRLVPIEPWRAASPYQGASLHICLGHSILISHKGAEISHSDLVHEVLHARRNLLECVPRLVPAGFGYHVGQLAILENDLEHLHVIPEEMDRVQDSASLWAMRYERAMTGLARLRPDEAPFYLLRLWAIVRRILPDHPTLSERASALLRHYDLEETAESYHQALEAASYDKRQAIDIALTAFPTLQPVSRVTSFQPPYRAGEVAGA